MLLEKALRIDLPEILAVQKLAFYDVGVFYKNFKLRPLLITLEELEKTFSKYVYLKVLENNNIIGSVRAFEENSVCKIENLIVHPDFQNRGIGKKLVLEIEDIFCKCRSYELFTGKSTPKNVAFYNKLGYEIIKETSATEFEPVLVTLEKTR